MTRRRHLRALAVRALSPEAPVVGVVCCLIRTLFLARVNCIATVDLHRLPLTAAVVAVVVALLCIR
jgi:hypothetical protein